MENFEKFKIELERSIGLIKDKEILSQINREKIKTEWLNKIYFNYQKITLSLVMLIKNQEEHIKEVLNKIRIYTDVDEFVVVDTGSTDNTIKFLEELEYVKMYKSSWIQDFGLMRNKAAEYATGNWILTMDSDEILLTENFSLKTLIALLESLVDFPFSCTFEQHYEKRSDYGFPERLYCRQNAQYFGRVHEEVRDLGTNNPVKNIHTRICIENLGVSREETIKFSKRELYARLLKEMVELEPSNPRWVGFLSLNLTTEELMSKEYENSLIRHLFIDEKSIFPLLVDNLKESKYTTLLIERYVSLLMLKSQFNFAKELIELGLLRNKYDSYLMFFKATLQIVEIQNTAKQAIKENLAHYLPLDKGLIYDLSHQDVQLFETALAELNLLSGNETMSKKIMSNIDDERSLYYWHQWQG